MTIAVAVLLATSCSDDTETMPQNRQVLLMTPCWRAYTDVEQKAKMPRRLPPYYSEDNTSTDDIGFFITTVGESPIESYFTKSSGTWRAMLEMNAGTEYQIFGYMPKGACTASIHMLDGESSYEAGSKLVLTGLKPITDDDVCVVVGVKQGEVGSTFATVDAQLGAFKYVGRSETAGNYVFLLFDHIYAAIGFKIRVDDSYDNLRTIKVKSMTLKTSRGAAVDVTVPLRANLNGADPVGTIVWSNYSGSECEETLFNYIPADPSDETDTGLELSTTLQTIGITCMVAPSINNYMTLHTVYDVYDKAGNLIRPNQSSDNKIPPLISLVRNQRTILQVMVKPSYLYVLSDDDLNNPKFEITQ